MFDPLDIAGRLVQEDLCILQEVDGELRLTAGVLCFPNRWRLSDKLGRPMMAIHEPVPSYAERLGKPVDRFIGLLAPDRPVWRLNWSLMDNPMLFQPVGHGWRDTDPDFASNVVGMGLSYYISYPTKIYTILATMEAQKQKYTFE